MIPERLCLWCEHFDMSFGAEGYSDYTPGYCGYISCCKGKFKQIDAPTEREYFVCIRNAETCPAFNMRTDLE